MSTTKQIAANRLNTQRSASPRSADGKAASSANCLKTGSMRDPRSKPANPLGKPKPISSKPNRLNKKLGSFLHFVLPRTPIATSPCGPRSMASSLDVPEPTRGLDKGNLETSGPAPRLFSVAVGVTRNDVAQFTRSGRLGFEKPLDTFKRLPQNGFTFLPTSPNTVPSDLAHLLIVDDDANTLASLARAFRLAGHEATVCDNAGRALELIKSQPFDMMLSDVVMPGKDGLSLLGDLRNLGITLPVVMISGQANIEMAVRATRLGAIDFLEKPLSTDKLLLTVENVLKLKRLEDENRDLRQRVGKHEIVHAGEAMRRVMAQVDRVAASEARICILGDTGTGKELIARALHQRSPRRAGPFVTLNCAAVPGELIESELFGHEKGSFTGAATRHIGKFEQANKGTLFLDEIGDMPLLMQAKLLRVLEERQVERVGGDRTIPVDVRVVVATHRDLHELVKKGVFREDLYPT